MRTGHRSSWLMVALVLVMSVLHVGSVAHAGDPNTGLLQLPLRWCAIKGSPAAANPGSLGEPDTDNVLWRRHERASDRTWIPGANITFRSAFTNQIMTQTNFPIIDDPKIGPGVEGDILDPNISDTELKQAFAACEAAWNALATQFNTPLLGPVAVNLRQFVDNSGNLPASNIRGRAYFSFKGTTGGNCTNPPSGLTSATGSLGISDYFFLRAFDPDEDILSHELGHVLGLGHGNGLDDNGNGPYDQFCDSAEDVNAAPASLMTAGQQPKVITALQRATARGFARVNSGVQIDPPAALINGDTISDRRSDAIQDVTNPAIDITWLTMSNHTPTQTTSFSHGLFGLLPEDAHTQYLVFADLDGDPGTGGDPSGLNLGVPTTFQGAELVTRVEVFRCCGEFPSQMFRPTVWKFQGGAFVEVTDPSIHASLGTAVTGELQELFSVISIDMSDAVRGPAGPAVRIQAFAQDTSGPGPTFPFDMLPNGPDSSSGAPINLVELQFPVCAVTPAQARPGQVATVEATGLFGSQMAKVILGDQMVGVGNTDAAGNVALTFGIPADAALGPRLVTVGVAGTALTADCTLELVGPVCEGLEPPVLSNVPAPIVVEQASLAGTAVSFTLPTATDDCGVVNVVAVPPSGSVFPLGATTVTVTATDAGGRQATATFTVTVEDNTAPTIASASVSPNKLWPPNHKKVPVRVSVSASDICDATPTCQIVSVSSNEPVNALGDGNTDPDWVITGLLTADLRPERSGTGNGRVYTLTVRCTDDSGNSSTKDVAVTVPKSQK